MKSYYSTTCRSCGRYVTTKANQSIGAVRIRCNQCGKTNYAETNADQSGAEA